MSICPHTIRVMEDWAGTKAQNTTKNLNSRHHALSSFDGTLNSRNSGGGALGKALRGKSTLSGSKEGKARVEESAEVEPTSGGQDEATLGSRLGPGAMSATGGFSQGVQMSYMRANT